MKRLILLLTILALGMSTVYAARQYPTTGRVVDEKGAPVAYANVVLLQNKEQVAGVATNSEGLFSLKAPTGNFTLLIQFLGYESLNKELHITDKQELGTLTLKASATEIEGVVVKAQLIRREADRFVVDVANTPAAIGKDGIELLERAPGVWITDEKISVNGKEGSKIYVNDRELKMETSQLLTYLRSLRADEITKIEVIPTSGADYDADSAGGIIKITLKKRRDDGVDGSVSFKSRQGAYIQSYDPSARINYHTGKIDINASGWGNIGHVKTISDENTAYTNANTNLTSHSTMKDKDRSFGGSIGTIYQMNDRHSIGAEFEFWSNNQPGDNNSYTDLINNSVLTHTDSRYNKQNRRKHYSATFNYIYKIDSLGSTLKFLADYTRRETSDINDNFTRATTMNEIIDSTYRDNSISNYNITTATVALDKKFSEKWTLKAGLKYTNNDMRNTALYQHLKNDEWVKNENQSFDIDYRENIAAAYGIVSANLGRLSIVAGLRGEYTHATGRGDYVKQSYFSLFPNANVSWSLRKDGSYSVVAQYARTISRPWFWVLTPARMQISDYMSQIGNPLLKASYTDDISLTFVMKYKYTVSVGINIISGEIQNYVKSDAEDPNKLILTWENFDATKNYYATVNLPFQLTKWWSANVNMTYMCQGARMEKQGDLNYHNYIFANLSTTFNLPKKFFIDISYRGSNKLVVGNMWVNAQHRLEAGIKKRLFNDRLTASFSVQNLLDQGQILGASSESFTREIDVKQTWNNRVYKIGLSYNFKSGKAFKSKSIENSSADEKSRL